jgi:integral membrane protein
MKQMIWLRYLALFEGVSWLLLLFVAMPLKYMAGNPYPVKVVGMGHGLLFIAFVAVLVLVLNAKSISNAMGAKVFIASFIPFGTFIIDGKLKKMIAQN